MRPQLVWALVMSCMLLGISTAEKAEAAPEARQFTLEELRQLGQDDDWLTGLWVYASDGAMTLYTLFEKTEQGYRALNFYPRYTVTWWTGKVEKAGDSVHLWDYEILNGKLLLPNAPTKVFQLKEGLLRLNWEQYYDTLTPVTDPEELSYVSGRKFITGEGWLRHKLAEAARLRGITRYYDLIKNSSLVQGHRGDLVDIEIVQEAQENGKHYLFARMTLARPPQSGHNGSVGWNGYYWACFKDDSNRQARIEDDWMIMEFADGAYLRLNLVTESDGSYKIVEKNLEAGSEGKAACYTFPQPGILQKPQPCNAH